MRFLIGEEVLFDGVEIGECVQEEYFKGEPVVAVLVVFGEGGLVDGETAQLGVVHPLCTHRIIGLLREGNRCSPGGRRQESDG